MALANPGLTLESTAFAEPQATAERGAVDNDDAHGSTEETPLYSSDPSSPVAKLVALLHQIDGLSAEFQQYSVRAEPQFGRIWLTKPNQFRLESDEPLSQTIVSDGSNLWTYDRDLEQVIISDVPTASQEIPILLFAGEPESISEQYRVEHFEDEIRDYFILTPRAADSLTTSLSLTFADDLPVRMTLENAMGQQTSIDLSQLSTELPEPSRYTFSWPDYVDVIDDRLPESLTTEPDLKVDS